MVIDRKRIVAAALVVVCGGALVWAAGLRRTDRTGSGRVPELDVVCTSCSWEETIALKRNWHRCPECGQDTVHLAATCPTCGLTVAFLDDEAYLENSVAAMHERADEVLPLCPDCGVRTIPKWAAFPKVVRPEQ